MANLIQRPMTDDERAEAEAALREAQSLSLPATAGCAGAALLLLASLSFLYAVPASGVVNRHLLALSIALILAGAIVLLIGVRRRPQPDHHTAKLRDDLKAGLVNVETHEARRAILIEDFEGLGQIYILEIAPDRCLCLRGQYLYLLNIELYHEHEKALPRRVHLPRTPLANLELMPVFDGEPLKPMAVFPPESIERVEALEDGAIIDVSLDELMREATSRPIEPSKHETEV